MTNDKRESFVQDGRDMPEPSGDASKRIGSELVREDASFADIVLQFVNSLSDRVSRMEDAIRAADFEALRVAAHQLKGSGGGYGYPVLTERAAELERMAKMKTIDECASALNELKQICSCVVAEAAD
jgi:HPt (histidine-containing phosphotransfer) domain-containing protein